MTPYYVWIDGRDFPHTCVEAESPDAAMRLAMRKWEAAGYQAALRTEGGQGRTTLYSLEIVVQEVGDVLPVVDGNIVVEYPSYEEPHTETQTEA